MFKELQHCETIGPVYCDYDGIAYHPDARCDR